MKPYIREYYIGSDGNYYEKIGNDYLEYPLDYFIIPQVTVTYHAAAAATPNQNGNYEYYSGSNGKYYEKIGNNYYEYPLDHFITPQVTVTYHAAVAATYISAGNTEYYTGDNGKYYVKNGNDYTETTLEAVTIAQLAPVINDNGDKVYSETVSEEPKDVSGLFAQAKSDEGIVEIASDDFAIVFDNNAVSSIGDSNVTLSAKVITENIEVEDAELVFEVTLTGATFESGEATVSIPFAKEVPAGKTVKVYYIDNQGNRTDMNATFENGKITFTTNHFSTYAVMFEDDGIMNWDVETSQSGNNFDISISTRNMLETAKIYVATFHQNVLKALSQVAITDNEGHEQVSAEGIDTVRVFCWDENLKPLFINKEYKLNE